MRHRIMFILSRICIIYASVDLEELCPCQSHVTPHFKERKEQNNPCNVVEMNVNGTWITNFNAHVSEAWMDHVPKLKFPGKKLVKHDFMTMVLFKPVMIESLQKHKTQQNVYIYWLISKIPSATSRFGGEATEYAFNLSPGYEYIEYEPLRYTPGDNQYILAFYHQHETKDYFSAHRYRKFDHFFDSLGEMVICNLIELTP